VTCPGLVEDTNEVCHRDQRITRWTHHVRRSGRPTRLLNNDHGPTIQTSRNGSTTLEAVRKVWNDRRAQVARGAKAQSPSSPLLTIVEFHPSQGAEISICCLPTIHPGQPHGQDPLAEIPVAGQHRRTSVMAISVMEGKLPQAPEGVGHPALHIQMPVFDPEHANTDIVLAAKAAFEPLRNCEFELDYRFCCPWSLHRNTRRSS
jgi:hypothetical protein